MTTKLPGFAFALRHPRWMEAVTAFVIRQPGTSAAEDEIIEHCGAHLGGFEVPKAVRLADGVPMTSTGGIRKHPLRRQYRRLYGQASVDCHASPLDVRAMALQDY